MLAVAAAAEACPFCNAVKPTLAQARDGAAAAFIAEAGAPDAAPGGKQTFLLHNLLRRRALGKLESLTVATDGPLKQGTLALLLGSGAADADPDQLQWTATALDEASCAYVGRAPSFARRRRNGWRTLPGFWNMPIR